MGAATVMFLLMLAGITPVAVLMPAYCINIYDRNVHPVGRWIFNIVFGVPLGAIATAATWDDFWRLVVFDIATPAQAVGVVLVSAVVTFHVMVTFAIIGVILRRQQKQPA